MKILFFDTETTGKPRNYKESMNNVDNWPRLVQIAWQTYNEEGELLLDKIFSGNIIVKPDGFTIPEEAARVHGITTEQAIEVGKPISEVFDAFTQLINMCDYIAGHNIMFDINVLGAEFIRAGIELPRILTIPVVDTMKQTTSICQLPGKYGYKWPTLTELHQFVFGRPFEGAHDAMTDIIATANCYFELRKRGFLKLLEEISPEQTYK